MVLYQHVYYSGVVGVGRVLGALAAPSWYTAWLQADDCRPCIRYKYGLGLFLCDPFVVSMKLDSKFAEGLDEARMQSLLSLSPHGVYIALCIYTLGV